MPIINSTISPYPSCLRVSQVNSDADADAEVIQMQAGKARWLAEFATGGPAPAGERLCTPVNPQGTYGHDHSGPPYGPAMRHSLFYFGGLTPVAADWTRQDSYAVGGASGVVLLMESDFIAKPFPPVRNTPYSRAYIDLKLQNQAAINATITIKMRCNEVLEKTETVALVAATAFRGRLAMYAELRPYDNHIEFEISSSVTTVTTLLLELCGSQVQKLTH